MDDFIEDFRRSLDGDDSVESFNFKTLIVHDISEENLKRIFDKLPNNSQINRNVRKLLLENKTGGAYVVPDPKNKISENEALSYATRYTTSVKQLLDAIGCNDIATDVNVTRIREAGDIKEFFSIAGDPENGLSDALDEISYVYQDRIEVITPGWTSLHEAVLGLTAYPNINYFILRPLLDFQLDTEAYYNLWRGGGDVAILKDEILVLRPQSL